MITDGERGDNPKTKVIVSPTKGIDLGTYTGNGTIVTKRTQRKLNRMVTAINKGLIDSNVPGSKLPWIQRMVHACKGRRTWSHKHKLLSDGCHIGSDLKDSVVKEINKCLTKL